jgi:Rho-binding antiterminator
MSDDNKPEEGYTPISCDRYSEYEVAILHREALQLQWRDEEGMHHTDRVTPRDLQTRNHCEYLIAEGRDGSAVEIRLDKIIQEPK